jgi:hypothetical protein
MSEYEGKWITTAEASEIIGISRKAVAKAIRKGKIKGVRNKTGEWMVDAGSARAYRDSPRKALGTAVTTHAVAAEAPPPVQGCSGSCNVDSVDHDWLLRSVSLMTPDEARNLARKVLEATVTDPAARLLIERHI